MKLMDGFNHDGHMIIDDISTWPADLLQLLDGEKQSFLDYNIEQERIDRLRGEDFFQRFQPHPNKYEYAVDATVEKIHRCLQGKKTVGFHCTRLTEDEIIDIRSNGLFPLTISLVDRRIQDRVSAGELSAKSAQELIRQSHASKSYRSGTVWLCGYRETLQEEMDVGRLFRSWGGEAVYTPHDHSASGLGGELNRIGQPCIVIGSVIATEYLTEKYMASYLDQRELWPDEYGYDLEVRHAVDVLDVI